MDVVVLGAGWTGRMVAHWLRTAGLSVAVVDPRPEAAASRVGLGVAWPLPPETPHRFLAAVGEPRARQMLRFATAELDTLPGFLATGILWEASEHERVELPHAIDALARIGAWVEACAGGWWMGEGGLVDLREMDAALATEVLPAPVPAEVTVRCTGWDREEAWLAGKLTPVRWQRQTFDREGEHTPTLGFHAQMTWCRDTYGRLTAFGGRWAEPTLGAGLTDPAPDARVTALLAALTARAFPGARPDGAPEAGIVAESCDGLPIVGPIPGRSREYVCTGFGVHALAQAWAGAGAIASMLTTGHDPLPRGWESGRFRGG